MLTRALQRELTTFWRGASGPDKGRIIARRQRAIVRAALLQIEAVEAELVRKALELDGPEPSA